MTRYKWSEQFWKTLKLDLKVRHRQFMLIKKILRDLESINWNRLFVLDEPYLDQKYSLNQLMVHLLSCKLASKKLRIRAETFSGEASVIQW